MTSFRSRLFLLGTSNLCRPTIDYRQASNIISRWRSRRTFDAVFTWKKRTCEFAKVETENENENNYFHSSPIVFVAFFVRGSAALFAVKLCFTGCRQIFHAALPPLRFAAISHAVYGVVTVTTPDRGRFNVLPRLCAKPA